MSDDLVAVGKIAGERRLITILFCDLVGSTVLSQRLDQEDYAEVVLSYQESARQLIERNGGIVANYSGDGVVGQFGYPDAHEDDAERAIVSGLEICKLVLELDRTLGVMLGERIQCRVGIHSSVSVVGTMVEGRGEMSIMGDTANIASRVEGVASPGQVVATAATLDLLHDGFETADHQRVELKGVAEPTEVARIVGRARTSTPTTDSVHVGRQATLRQLEERWQQAQQQSGSFVTVSAIAGSGKSAAIQAFLARLDQPIVVRAQGRSLAMAQPFAVLGQLADACIEHDAFEPGSSVYTAATTVRTLLDQPLPAGMSAEERWQERFESGMELLASLTGAPVIIVVEDLHWTDSSTEEIIERFAKTIANEPVLLITSSRPGPALGTAELIELEPIDDEHMRELVDRHAAEPLPPAIVDDILARAQGVPLFAVELARSARPDANAVLPDSLQASLLSRLAQRPELARVAQVASVLGDVVDLRVLATLLQGEDDIAGTVRALGGDHVLELNDAGQCQFTHSLLREAIYGSMLRGERRTLHQQAADAITADGGRDDHRLTLVGHHLALGAKRIEAAGCYDIAARRAAAMGAFHDAVELADRGLELLGKDSTPSSELLGLTMTKGNATFATVGYNAPGLLELWQGAESTAEQIGNRLEQSSGMNGQSVAALFAGDYALAIERADRIVTFGKTHNDRPALVRGYCSTAIPQLYMGQVADALRNAELAIEVSEVGDYELLTYGFGTDHLAIAYANAATAAFFAGDSRARELANAAIEHSARIDSPISLAMARNNAATLALFSGDSAEAINQVSRTWALCDRFSLPFFRMVTSLTKAAALAMEGDTAATELAYAALGDAEEGSNLALSLGLYTVALCEEATGNADGAFDLAEMGLGIVEANNERILEVELAMLQARCRPSEAATSRLTAAIDLAHTRGALGSISRANEFLA